MGTDNRSPIERAHVRQCEDRRLFMGSSRWSKSVRASLGANFERSLIQADVSCIQRDRKKMGDNQWWELYDSECQCSYYYNVTTQETVWERPDASDIIPLARLQVQSS